MANLGRADGPVRRGLVDGPVCVNYADRLGRRAERTPNWGHHRATLAPEAVLWHPEPIAPSAAAEALAGVSRRFALLRSACYRSDGQWRIAELDEPPVPEVETISLRAEEVDAWVAALGPRDVHVDGRGGLVMTSLIRLTLVNPDAAGVVVFWLDHLVADRLSGADFVLAFAEELDGWSGRSTTEAVSYIDFATWQNAYLASPAGREDISHRLDHLQPVGLRPPFGLPEAEGWQSISLAPARRTVALGPAASAIERCHEEGYTPYVCLVAALWLVAARLRSPGWQGVIGVTAGRPITVLRHTFGWLANTSVLCGEVRPDLSLRDVLVSARDSVLQALDYEHVPFYALAARAAPASFGRSTRAAWMFVSSGPDGGAQLRGESALAPYRAPYRPFVPVVRPLVYLAGPSELTIEYPAGRYRADVIQRLLLDVLAALTANSTAGDRSVRAWLDGGPP